MIQYDTRISAGAKINKTTFIKFEAAAKVIADAEAKGDIIRIRTLGDLTIHEIDGQLEQVIVIAASGVCCAL